MAAVVRAWLNWRKGLTLVWHGWLILLFVVHPLTPYLLLLTTIPNPENQCPTAFWSSSLTSW